MGIFRKFVKTDLYLILTAVLGFLIWFFQPEISISAGIVFIVANFLLFTQKDSNGLFYLFIIMLVSNIAGSDVRLVDLSSLLSDRNLLITILLIGVLVLELLIFLIAKFKKRNRSSLWVGLVLIGISFAISGVRQDGSIYFNNQYADAAAMGLVVFLFLFFIFTFEHDSKRYICKCLLYLGVYVSFQFFATYIMQSINSPETLFELRPNLIWGNGNAAALIILLCFPAGAYLYIEKPNFYYFFLTRIAFIGVLVSTSRGGILCGIIAVVATDIYARLQMTNHRKYNLVYFGSAALLLSALVMSFDMIKPFIEFTVNRFFIGDDLNGFSSGRIELYKAAIEAFLSSPITGIGTALTVVYDVTPWYHSTLFDTLASTGVVGTVMFIIHMFQKYRLLFKNRKDPFVFFVFIGFICSGLYGMIDVAYYNLIWLMMFAIILAVVEVQVKSRANVKVETLTPSNK